MRARKAIPIVLTAATTLVAAGSASAVTGRYSVGGLTATFTAPTTHPSCKQKWPVTVTASFHGRRAHATAYYQFLEGGQLVSTQYPFSGTPKNPHSHIWHFYGSFYDYTFGPFGARAIGYRLNVRAVVQVGRIRAYPGVFVTVHGPARGCPP